MSLKDLKNKIIKNTVNDIYCRLRPSDIHGVGVFAIRDIPKDTNPFKWTALFSLCMHINKDELKDVPNPVMEMLSDFSYSNKHNNYIIDIEGINSFTISWYLNQSDAPNMKPVVNKTNNIVQFETIRKIKVGEELTFNYDDYNQIDNKL